ncbi:hypothetical protein EVAR_29479_1 [Eumeta japonica]|uniref:Adipokinetic hormone n=1 Tax=Eumeta variegata TaxID=151549 RepID=A0A4C1WU32_EUMVA|nr:hypothetical protein EVAR_29479_1 [Eumeta japonica]
MHTVLRGVALLTLLCCWCVCGQITFSRDWMGGKRAHAPEDAQRSASNCHRYNRICRHFIHELKAALSAEVLADVGPTPASCIMTTSERGALF